MLCSTNAVLSCGIIEPSECCFSDGMCDNVMYVAIHFISPCPFFSFIDQHVCANYVFSNTIDAAPAVTLTIHDKAQSFLVCSAAPPVANTLTFLLCAHVNANLLFFSFKYQHVCAKAFGNEQLRAALSFK